MQHAYRIHGQVSPDGSLTLEHLPFQAGEDVEVIVLADERRARDVGRYPLRGKPITFIDPMRPVAEGDWDVLQ